MFAIGLENVDLPNVRDIFSVTAMIVSINENVTTEKPIELIPCTMDIWHDISNDREEVYEDHKIGKMLCLA